MVYCCAVGCSNDSRFVSKGQGISFHCFPTEDSLLKEWLAKISRVGLEVTKDTPLCSDYFEPDCFERDLRAELLGLLGSKGKRRWSRMLFQQFLSIDQGRSLDYQLKSAFKKNWAKKVVRIKILATCNSILLLRKTNATAEHLVTKCLYWFALYCLCHYNPPRFSCGCCGTQYRM